MNECKKSKRESEDNLKTCEEKLKELSSDISAFQLDLKQKLPKINSLSGDAKLELEFERELASLQNLACLDKL